MPPCRTFATTVTPLVGVQNFYKQYEGTIELYNEKFAKPAKSIKDMLYASKKLTPTPFDEKIEWIYYELWHHEGRRARMAPP